MAASPQLHAAIAAHRFGLGEADLAVVGGDARGWLEAQIGPADAPRGGGLLDTRQALELVAAEREKRQLARNPPALLPARANVGAYKEAWDFMDLAKYFLNTVVIAVGALLVQLAVQGTISRSRMLHRMQHLLGRPGDPSGATAQRALDAASRNDRNPDARLIGTRLDQRDDRLDFTVVFIRVLGSMRPTDEERTERRELDAGLDGYAATSDTAVDRWGRICPRPRHPTQ